MFQHIADYSVLNEKNNKNNGWEIRIIQNAFHIRNKEM